MKFRINEVDNDKINKMKYNKLKTTSYDFFDYTDTEH